MKRSDVNLVFVIATALALVLVQHFAPRGLYAFDGHGRALAMASKGVIGLLCLTHIILAGIMWVQRTSWDAADASAFRFMAIKAEFWGFFLFTFPIKDGITLTSTLLSVYILYTAVDLISSLFRRYVLDASFG